MSLGFFTARHEEHQWKTYCKSNSNQTTNRDVALETTNCGWTACNSCHPGLHLHNLDSYISETTWISTSCANGWISDYLHYLHYGASRSIDIQVLPHACDCGWNNISPTSSSTEEGTMQYTNLDTCLPPELSSNKKSSLFSLSQLIWKFLGFITISTCNYHRFPPKNSQVSAIGIQRPSDSHLHRRVIFGPLGGS